MADLPGTGSPPATPPAGGAPTTPPATPPAPPEPETFPRDYVENLRRESAAHRTAKAAAETELKQLRDEKLSDAERLANRAKELEKEASDRATELRQERAFREVERSARKLKIVDEETALALISSKIDYDDAGKPTNIEKLLAELVKAKPFLLAAEGAAAPPAGNPGNGAAGRTGQLTMESVKSMSREQILANWDAVQAAIKTQR